MGVVKSIFTTVSGLYNNINPITLSGVNDIIVIKGEDGELKCSPFQLRFSKLKFTTARNQVHIIVNGKLTEIDMTITSQGDLFFEQEIVKDECEYEKVMDYLQSPEVQILSILQDSLDFVKKLSSEEQSFLNRCREKNLRLRMFSKNFMKHEDGSVYNNLLKQYARFSNLLCSPENYEYLLKNYKRLLQIMENIINKNTQIPKISFSVCLNAKIEKSFESVFDSFLVKDIENPENTAVKLESESGHVFFISFTAFSRMYFEILLSKNRKHRLVEFLEKEYNKSVGWSFFKSKKTLKRDVCFSLTLNSDELKSLNLNPGKNEVVFKISGINKQLDASIYFWNANDKIIVSDVDGTITKSDVRGHLYNLMGRDWTHSGIAPLYSKIVKNGYRIIYLTSRPLGQSFSTKSYLKQVSQDDCTLPDGPVIHNPEGVLEAIYKEVILKRPEEFKIACLKQIKSLFNGRNPFIAGFGNRITDVVTYKTMDIPENKIYTVNALGHIQAEYSKATVGTYHTINEFIDSIFPPINMSDRTFLDHSYSNFKWWKAM
ncbi:uncharacterized protein VICG_00725 [Vittaforma corneae ATCC 50505]|uniref:LNS2/PITP domain-containing protein n=1 Tax=Vittaforma corneae (strain ATCC 50505) TaxID=993615 RepID=L2GP82_VITCO|nr:uncharacterized protein VICG_00725 [Vittaforma corneae ATCC 50505]ELA42325.1 hypothetical protein VICG_00725 [Vittaforma corneae ATCC 50505]